MNPERFFFSCSFYFLSHAVLKTGYIEVGILGFPAIDILSAGIESGKMSLGIQTGLANQGRKYNSALYPQGGRRIIVHYDFLYLWKTLFSGNTYC